MSDQVACDFCIDGIVTETKTGRPMRCPWCGGSCRIDVSVVGWDALNSSEPDSDKTTDEKKDSTQGEAARALKQGRLI